MELRFPTLPCTSELQFETSSENPRKSLILNDPKFLMVYMTGLAFYDTMPADITLKEA